MSSRRKAKGIDGAKSKAKQKGHKKVAKSTSQESIPHLEFDLGSLSDAEWSTVVIAKFFDFERPLPQPSRSLGNKALIEATVNTIKDKRMTSKVEVVTPTNADSNRKNSLQHDDSFKFSGIHNTKRKNSGCISTLSSSTRGEAQLRDHKSAGSKAADGGGQPHMRRQTINLSSTSEALSKLDLYKGPQKAFGATRQGERTGATSGRSSSSVSRARRSTTAIKVNTSMMRSTFIAAVKSPVLSVPDDNSCSSSSSSNSSSSGSGSDSSTSKSSRTRRRSQSPSLVAKNEEDGDGSSATRFAAAGSSRVREVGRRGRKTKKKLRSKRAPYRQKVDDRSLSTYLTTPGLRSARKALMNSSPTKAAGKKKPVSSRSKTPQQQRPARIRGRPGVKSAFTEHAATAAATPAQSDRQAAASCHRSSEEASSVRSRARVDDGEHVVATVTVDLNTTHAAASHTRSGTGATERNLPILQDESSSALDGAALGSSRAPTSARRPDSSGAVAMGSARRNSEANDDEIRNELKETEATTAGRNGESSEALWTKRTPRDLPAIESPRDAQNAQLDTRLPLGTTNAPAPSTIATMNSQGSASSSLDTQDTGASSSTTRSQGNKAAAQETERAYNRSKHDPAHTLTLTDAVIQEDETFGSEAGTPGRQPQCKVGLPARADSDEALTQPSSMAQIDVRTNDDVIIGQSQRNMFGFIPRIELQRLCKNPQPLTEANCVSFPAAVMFVDISGFTKLTERLTNDPDIKSGAETLTRILNAFFDELLKVIEAYGGDVVKFCGDAILVVFHQGASLKGLTLSAAACAIVVQDRFASYETGSGSSFSVHMGLGAGIVHKMYVGGMFQRWEMVFAGEPMLQIKTATDDAKAGQTALSPEAWALVKEFATGSKFPSGNVLLGSITEAAVKRTRQLLTSVDLSIPDRVDPSTFVAVRKYVPGAVLARLTAGQTWTEINELRQVTVVFFNTPNLEVREAEELSTLQAVAHAAQNSLYHFEGSVNKFLVDDKGSTLIGAFGLPPLAHEDDAVRGLQCGLRIREYVGKLGINSSVGIATGKIFCGILGSQTRCEYAVMGDTVNISARLMQACSPDGILCDETTFQLSSRWLDSRNISCAKLEPIQVKGKTNKLAVFKPQASSVNHGEVLRTMYSKQSHSMVGRMEEREIVERAMIEFGATALTLAASSASTSSQPQQQLPHQHQSRCIWVEGDAGIGKSEYVSYAYQLSATHGYQMCVGAANSVEQATMYYAWRTIFSQLFTEAASKSKGTSKGTGAGPPPGAFISQDSRMQSSSNMAVAAAKSRTRDSVSSRVVAVLTEIDMEFVALVPLLSVVLPVDTQETPSSRALPDDSRAANTQEMLVRILQYFAERAPLVITLEDCHWLDSKSISLLLDVASRVKPLMILATSRPMEAPKKSKIRKRRSSMIVESQSRNVPQEYHKILLLPTTRFLALEDIAVDFLLSIVANRLGIKRQTMPQLVIDVIAAKAKGNPFVALELIGHMRDTGYLKIEGDTCEISNDVTSVDDIEFPENVRGLIAGRVDRLKPEEQMVLRIASAIGNVFDFDTLQTCLLKLKSSATNETDLQRMVTDLQTNGFIQYHGMHETQGCDEFRFDMDIVQDVVYNRMSYAHRRVVHMTVAQYIEENNKDNLTQHLQLLAHHYKKADMTFKALHYLAEAGKDASAIHAHNEVVKIFTEALKLYRLAKKRAEYSKAGSPTNNNNAASTEEKEGDKDDADEVDGLGQFDDTMIASWHTALGGALTDLGQLGAARKHCEASLAILDHAFPKGEAQLKGRLLEEVVRQYLINKQLRMFATVATAATQTLNKEEQRRMLLTSETYSMMGRLTYFSGNQNAQAYAILRSLNLALRACKASSQLARCYASACVPAAAFGAFSKAESYSRQALIIAEAVDDPATSLYTLILTSLFFIQAGKLASADNGLIRAMLIASKQGNPRRWEEASNMRATVAHLGGKFKQASSLFATAAESAIKRGDHQMHARLVTGRVGSLLMMGNIDTAADLIIQMDLLAHKNNLRADRYLKISNLAIEAATNVFHKSFETAMTCAQAALKLIQGIRNPTQAAMLTSYCFIMDVFLHLLYLQNLPGSDDAAANTAAIANTATATTTAAKRKSGGSNTSPRSKLLGTSADLPTNLAPVVPSNLREDVQKGLISFSLFATKFPVAQPWAHLYHGRFLVINNENEEGLLQLSKAAELADAAMLTLVSIEANAWIASMDKSSPERTETLREAVNAFGRHSAHWKEYVCEVEFGLVVK